MWIHTHARGSDKNGAIWCILSVPKYVIMNIKINTFKVNKLITTQFIHPRLSNINPELHISTIINLFILNNGVGGATGHRILRNLKKSNKMEAFPIR